MRGDLRINDPVAGQLGRRTGRMCMHHPDDLLDHQALLYAGADEYADGLQRLLAPALARGEPVVVSVPADRHAALGGRLGPGVQLLDMARVGRNPGRIIPLIEAVAAEHPDRPIRIVGEPVWPGRSDAEIREAMRHEALVNLAFEGRPMQLICPYDTSRLAPGVLADAECTHPWLVEADDGRRQRSARYDGASPPAACDAPLPAPPAHCAVLRFDRDDLPHVRAFVAEHTGAARLGEDRAAELVLAVNELATNTIRHARTTGTLHAWTTPAGVTFQISDGGRILDPLAGRRLPGRGSVGGRGLWLVHQLCDLVETRTGQDGTVVRLHVHRDA